MLKASITTTKSQTEVEVRCNITAELILSQNTKSVNYLYHPCYRRYPHVFLQFIAEGALYSVVVVIIVCYCFTLH